MLAVAERLVLFVVFFWSALLRAEDLVIDEALRAIIETSADLSLIAFFEEPDNRNGYDAFKVYSEGDTDQSLLVRTDDKCYVAFRGTLLGGGYFNLADMFQYIQLGTEEVCPANEAVCCQTRTGLWDAYNTNYREELESDLADCLAAITCDDGDDCLVLTGQSQGGSAAQIAAVLLQQYDPLVVTFGTEPTLNEECPHVADATRWFRFANTGLSFLFRGIEYDRFPFISNRYSNFGYTLLLSDGGVANLGLNSQDKFGPAQFLSVFNAHSMGSYRSRIQALGTTVAVTGYAAGSPCTQASECEAVADCTKEWWQLFSPKRCTNL